MTEPSFTIKEIVLEIRDDVKDLTAKVDRIDQQGSIGTRSALDDHENRLRIQEKFRYGFPSIAVLSFIVAVASAVVTVIYST